MPSRRSQTPTEKAGLESRLADALISTHPERAAVALERLGLSPAIDFITGLSNEQLCVLVPRLSPLFAAEALGALSVERIAGVLELLPLDLASRIARLLGDQADAAISQLAAPVERALRALLRYPEDSAGGLMDPLVLALPEDLTAAEALEQIRAQPKYARYNLNVVDRSQALVGVLNLRELLVAPSDAHLSTLMVESPYRLNASASRANIISHPGWREAHSLPVVDDQGRYLGTVRYRTLRRLEDALRTRDEQRTSEALGELLAVGAGSILRAVIDPHTSEGS